MCRFTRYSIRNMSKSWNLYWNLQMHIFFLLYQNPSSAKKNRKNSELTWISCIVGTKTIKVLFSNKPPKLFYVAEAIFSISNRWSWRVQKNCLPKYLWRNYWAISLKCFPTFCRLLNITNHKENQPPWWLQHLVPDE